MKKLMFIIAAALLFAQVAGACGNSVGSCSTLSCDSTSTVTSSTNTRTAH